MLQPSGLCMLYRKACRSHTRFLKTGLATVPASDEYASTNFHNNRQASAMSTKPKSNLSAPNTSIRSWRNRATHAAGSAPSAAASRQMHDCSAHIAATNNRRIVGALRHTRLINNDSNSYNSINNQNIRTPPELRPPPSTEVILAVDVPQAAPTPPVSLIQRWKPAGIHPFAAVCPSTRFCNCGPQPSQRTRDLYHTTHTRTRTAAGH
jgi:hypothetical protein